MPTRCQLRIRNTLQFCSSVTSKLSSDTVAVKTVWIYTEQRNKNDDELFMKAKDKKNIFAKEESTTCSDKLFIMSLQSSSPTHNIFLWWRIVDFKVYFCKTSNKPSWDTWLFNPPWHFYRWSQIQYSTVYSILVWLFTVQMILKAFP